MTWLTHWRLAWLRLFFGLPNARQSSLHQVHYGASSWKPTRLVHSALDLHLRENRDLLRSGGRSIGLKAEGGFHTSHLKASALQGNRPERD